MAADKPQDIEQYKKWLSTDHHVVVAERTTTYYDSVANKMLKDFSSSPFWTALIGELESISQEYYIATSYHLLSTDAPPELKVKPFDSFLLKTFRKNVLENSNWPDEPTEGWILPASWYTQINDIIRTLIVVKYLDGVHFLVDRIQSLLEDHDLAFEVDYEATEKLRAEMHGKKKK